MRIRRAIDRISHHGAEVAAIGTAGMGLFTLGAWAFDQWRFTTFGLEYVPMAPIAAVLFVLLGLAMGACHRWPDARPIRIFGVVSVIITVVVSALVAAQSSSYFPLPWDGWLAHPDLRAGAMPMGRMSPFTSAAFLLSASSLLVRALGPPVTRLLRWSAAIAAGAGLLVGLVIALGYAAGTPVFYGGQTVPMALLTAIAFVTLNLGLLLTNGAVSGLLDWFSLGLDSDIPETQRHFVWRLLAILAGLVTAISLTGFFHLKHQQTTARADVYSHLNTIADLKMTQIVNWRNERLGDARLLMQIPSLARSAAVLFANSNSAAASTEILVFINALRNNYRYDAIVLFDNRMNPRLAVPSAAETSGPRLRALLEAVPGASDVLVSDLHRGINGDIHLDLVAPIRNFSARPPGQNSDPAESAATPVGAMLLRINPRDFLYPLIQTWPTPSATAETLLVRREGNEVVYLNELRHRKGTALALRRPVSDPHLPSAMFARGERGLVEGVDYRGVPVLSAVRAVPDSPWLLVTKVDQTEAYAPIRAEAWRTGLMVGLLLLAVVLAAAYLWRQRHAALLRHELILERESKALAERLAMVTRHANDIILLLDETGRIVEANDRALTSYGCTLDELRQLPPGGLRPPEAQENPPQQLDLFASREGAVFETTHRRGDGTTFPVEVSSRSVEIEGRQFNLGICRDITERKQAEEALRESETRYAALFEHSPIQAIVVDRSGRIQAFNRAKRESDDRLPQIGEVMYRDYASKHTMDMHGELMHCILLGESRHYPERPYGKRILSIDIAPFPDGAIITSQDITERKQAEKAMEESEERLRTVIEASLDAIVAVDIEGRIVLFNGAAQDLFRYSREEALNQPVKIMMREETGKIHQEKLERFLNEGVGQCGHIGRRMEKTFRRKDGSLFEAEASMSGGRHDGLRLVVLVVHDITGRKKKEEALKTSEKRFRDIADHAQEWIWEIDVEGKYTYASHVAEKILGYTPEEILGKHFYDFFHPDDRESLKSAALAAFAVKQPFREFINRNAHKNGQTVWLATNGLPVLDDKGNLLGYRGSDTDITERKRADEALRESEQRYRVLVETAPDVIYTISAEDGTLTSLNKAFETLTGWPRAEWLGKPFAGLVHPDDLALALKTFQKVSRGETLASYELRILSNSGNYIVGEFTSIPQVKEGKVMGELGIVRNITERKQAEKAMEESEERLRTVIEASLDAIVAVDIEGRIVLFNGAAQDLFRYSREEALNQPVKILLREETGEIHQKKLERFLSEGVGQCGHIGRRIEKTFRRKDGSLFEAEVSMSGGRHDELRLVVLAVHDITERKRAEEALRNREDMLQRIFDLLPVGLWFADKDGKLLRGNPAGVKIWGAELKVDPSKYGVFKARRLPSGEEVAPDDWALAHTIRDKVTIVDELLEIDAFDGKKKAILNYTAPVLDAQGNVQGAIVVNLDITERKQAEEALCASEERFRAIASNTPDHILVQDRDLRYSFVVNPQLGLTEADMIGKTDFDFLRKEEAEKLTTIKRKVLETGEPFHLVASLSNSKGETEFFDGSYVPKRDSTGKVVGLIGYFRNITERIRAAETLRESEETMRYMVKHDPNAIAIYDLNMHYIAVSDRYLHDYNVKEENVIGKHHYEVFPEMPQRWKDVHQRCLSGAIERNDDDYFERPDGSITYNRWECRPWYRGDGAIGGMITYTEVTTERKIAEIALKESEAKYRDLIEQAWDAIFVVDPGGKILLVNDQACRMLGYTQAELAKLNLAETYAAEERAAMAERIAKVQRGEHLRYERSIVRKDGTTFPVEVAIGMLPKGLIQGIVRDISDRKQAEEALRHEFAMRSMLLENLPCIAMVLRKKTREIVFLNETARQAGAAPGKTCYGTCSQRSDPCPFCLAPEVWATNQPRQLEVEYRGKHYEGRWVPLTDDLYVHYIFDITERKQTEESLRELSLRLSRAVDKERRRIARELHDSTGQKLAALSMMVGLLQDATGVPDGKTDKLFADCLAMIEQCAQEIRTQSYLLHPPLLDELGLAVAIGSYIEGFSKRSGVQVALEAPPDIERLPAEVEIALFRVVQESLGNIHHHAGASTARIHLACDAEQVTLEVSDRGRGMSAETIRAIEAGRGSTGVGFAGMRERLRLLGGRLEIESGGQGTVVRAIIPRPQEPT